MRGRERARSANGWKRARSARCARSSSGRTARSGRRPSSGRSRSTTSRRRSIGTCGSVRRRSGHITLRTCRSSGAVLGLRHRRAGGHGVPHHGRRLLGARSRPSHAHRARVDAALQGDSTRGLADHVHLRAKGSRPKCEWCGTTAACIPRAHPRWPTTRPGRSTGAAVSSGSAPTASSLPAPTATIPKVLDPAKQADIVAHPPAQKYARSPGVYRSGSPPAKGHARRLDVRWARRGPDLYGAARVSRSAVGRVLEINPETGQGRTCGSRRSTSGLPTGRGGRCSAWWTGSPTR